MLPILRRHWFAVILLIAFFGMAICRTRHENEKTVAVIIPEPSAEWKAPDITMLGKDSLSALVRYGKDLVAQTAAYLGPKGSIAHITNGMNCQNCHLEAGARPYGNCLSAVAATYPLYRPRSGRIESIEFRVNDCLQRSLNGQALDSSSREMRAIVAYIKWLGATSPKGTRPPGAGVAELPVLSRAANTIHGKEIFKAQCSRCHGTNGEGQLVADSTGFTYPPLWGNNSYNTGAGMYRISKLAAYVKDNMPYNQASHSRAVLSDEEAWDVAAFINTQPHPQKKYAQDWPTLAEKAFDMPFGPYPDAFPSSQHKYGPFEPIKKAQRRPAK
jgi:thiosulfate dehydrogenase